MSLEGIIHPALPQPTTETADQDTKAHAPSVPYRSWRKKYKKMRQRFARSMQESNQLAKDENRSLALARRLQEENDQFMEMLLDLRGTGNLAVSAESMIGLEVEPDLTALAESDTIETEEEILAPLLQMPHKTYTIADMGESLTNPLPSNFLDVAYRDEFLANLDAQLSESNMLEDGNLRIKPPPSRTLLSDKELVIQNTDSVISWLRRNHPETFIQDHEKDKPEPKKRGGGKRASLAQSSTTIKTEHEEREDEVHDAPEPPEKPIRGGRKTKDDEAYRPKGGNSRSAKRKRADEGDTKGRGKRAKATATPA